MPVSTTVHVFKQFLVVDELLVKFGGRVVAEIVTQLNQ